jgi:hypothetical protein
MHGLVCELRCHGFADMLAIAFGPFAQIVETDQDVDIAAAQGDRIQSDSRAARALLDAAGFRGAGHAGNRVAASPLLKPVTC